MRILILSSEATPFAKTGGLADVSSSLCVELNKLGHDARVLIPEYTPLIDREKYKIETIISNVKVELNGHDHTCNIERARIPFAAKKDNAYCYFVQYGGFFERPGIYSEAGIDYWDNPQRFAFFCKAALQMCLQEKWIPDIIHCNDWQTAMLPVYFKTRAEYNGNPAFAKTKILMTIHNLAYQGRFDSWYNQELEIGPESFHLDGVEFYGDLNFLKGGIKYADYVSTVSPTYANEIQTPEFGCALDGVLRSRSQELCGILNGIDESVWKPSTDKVITAKFTVTALKGKAACKAALQKELGLPVKPSVPLIGIVSRLTYQKGIDLFLSQLDYMMSNDIQIAVLGTGDENLVKWLGDVASNYPKKVSASVKFDEKLSHQIIAGSDMFMMPSRFEPCGLTQMYAMKYGTLPIVRATGGLRDTVKDATEASIKDKTATGFSFERFYGWDMMQCFERALRIYHEEPKVWKQIMRTAMRMDFSWKNSAEQYVKLYKKMLNV